MKNVNGKFIWVALFVIVLVLSYHFISTGTLFFTVPTTENNQLLVLSTGSTQFLEGTNVEGLGVGNYVTAQFNVGGGNDIAAVGSSDKDNVNLETPKTGWSNPTFYFAGYKSKMNTILPFASTALRSATRVQSVQSSVTKDIGYFDECNNYKDVLTSTALSAAKSAAGSNLIAFAVDKQIYTENANLLGNVKTCRLYYVRAQKLTNYSFSDYAYQNKYLDWEMKFQLYNSSGTVSSEVTLNNAKTSGILTSSGSTIGKVIYDSISLSGGNLPIDLVDDTAMYYNGKWGNGTISKNQTVVQLTNSLTSNYPTTCISYSGCKQLDLSTNTFGNMVNNINSEFDSAVSSTYFQTSVGGVSFNKDVSSNKFVFDTKGTYTPHVVFYAKADWIGIIKQATELTLTCNPQTISITEGASQSTTVTVKNTSQVNGTYNLSSTCPVALNMQDSVNAGASKSYNMNWQTAFSGAGFCNINLTYDGTGSPKSCSIQYNITKKQTYICPNNLCESGLGENSTNCFADCGTCPTGQEKVNGACVVVCTAPKVYVNGQCMEACTAPKVMNEFGLCVEVTKCGNGVIDTAEDCSSCKADMIAVKGATFCDTPIVCPAGQHLEANKCVDDTGGISPFTVVMIGIIIIALVAGGYLILSGNKKGRRLK